MLFSFAVMDETSARAILAWRYDGQYDFYNAHPGTVEEDLPEMLDGTQFSVRDEHHELVGFFAVGEVARVPGGHVAEAYKEDALDIGVGMRPDLTGRGLGKSFVEAGLRFLQDRYEPSTFRLSVAVFNERAIRVYERTGFERDGVFSSLSTDGVVEFLVMRRGAYAR